MLARPWNTRTFDGTIGARGESASANVISGVAAPACTFIENRPEPAPVPTVPVTRR